MESQSKTKSKLAARLPGHLPERIMLKRLTNNRKGVSQRCLGCKFRVSQITNCGQLSKINISCFKREKTPNYTEKQAEKAKNLCKKLANLLNRSKCCVVLDDEKYFTHDGRKR